MTKDDVRAAAYRLDTVDAVGNHVVEIGDVALGDRYRRTPPATRAHHLISSDQF
jgi:hypothetical protein